MSSGSPRPTEEAVRLDRKGAQATITINRPQALNAINQAVLDGLDGVIGDLEKDLPRCVVVTGAGTRAFAAGADVARMKDMNRDEAAAFSASGNAVFRRLERLPVPVVAAVGGYALGGGCELALACDLRIAADTAVFGQPEVSLGIIPGFGGTQRLARIIGAGLAKELVFTGRSLTAAEALRIGLVNAVCPAGELMAQVDRLANRIAANSFQAIRAAKVAIDLGMQADIDTGLRIETELFSALFGSADQRHAMAGFVSQRSNKSKKGGTA